MRRTALLLPIVAFLPILIAAAPTTKPVDDKANPKTALASKVNQISLTSVALGDAIDYLRDVSGANIHVNWRALELLNITRSTPVSVRLNDVTVRRVLQAVLDDASADKLLTYYVDDGILEITTKEIADSQMITVVYPVEDLVAEIPNFEGPTFNLQNQSNQTSGQGGGGGGSSQSLFSGSTNATASQGTTKGQRADDLVTLIKDTVQPGIWRDNGGTAAIRYFNGHLIVTAPRSVHEALSTRFR